MTISKLKNSSSTDKNIPTKIDIKDINKAIYIGKYVEFVGTLTEKERTPFVARTGLEFNCNPSEKSTMCGNCSHLNEGHWETKLDVYNANVLGFINAKKNESNKLVKAALKIPSECKRAKVSSLTVNENLYRCSIVPCIDYASSENKSVSETVDNMYSIFVAAVLFGDLEVHENRDHIFRGVPHIDPSDGRQVVLIDEAIPVADDISNFKLTSAKKRMLEIYQCAHTVKDVMKKNHDILKEKRNNHHKIFGFERMEYFVHMTFNSVSAFMFENTVHHRGWLDGAIIGDSRSGKSGLIEGTIDLHNIGYKVACNNITVAGILGGMSQSSIKGGAYQLKWGLLPRLDRRIVCFDECHDEKAIYIWPKLNDMRASGLVKISKVGAVDRTTRARVRKIFISNPPNGTTADYYRPVQMLSRLFTTPECIARLDYMFVPRLQDSTRANEDTEEVVPNYFATGAHKLLNQFIYSRTAEQVVFTKEAEEYIVSKAEEIAKISDSIQIPLIQGNEAPYTFARGAAAQAAALYSVDDSGEVIVVHKAHAEVWIDNLIANYSHESNGYFEHSYAEHKKIKFENSDEFFKVTAAMRDVFKECKSMVPYLLSENQFNFKYLADIWDIGIFELKKVYSRMIKYNLIHAKATNSSFHKSRRGIVVFKYLSTLEDWSYINEENCKLWFDKLSGF